MFGRGRGARGTAGGGFSMPGPDRQFALTVDFVEAATGGRKRIALSPDEWLDVTIPAGIEQDQVLRLKGKGAPGFGGGPPGDALIEVHVAPHPLFRREGDNINVDLPVSLAEAVLGARVPVPTVGGPVTMTIPKGSDTGTRLRLRGRGIHRRGHTAGDQYVTLKVVIGASGDPELAQFLEEWAKTHPVNPRRDIEAAGAPRRKGLPREPPRDRGRRTGPALRRTRPRRAGALDRATLGGAGDAARGRSRDLAVSRGRCRARRVDPRHPAANFPPTKKRCRWCSACWIRSIACAARCAGCAVRSKASRATSARRSATPCERRRRANNRLPGSTAAPFPPAEAGSGDGS